MAEIMTFGEMDEVLRKARQVYGNKNQIMVCIEELNELACVLAKYPRYADEKKATQELHDKALDEVADVYTILEHVKKIMDITEDELLQRRMLKVNRVKKWLSHSDSMQETVDDRELESSELEGVCGDCMNVPLDERTYDSTCVHCLKAQATEGIAPFKVKR